MAYKIRKDDCVNCGACEAECPNGAIAEKDGHREIDEGSCVSCGACAGACPCSAIDEG